MEQSLRKLLNAILTSGAQYIAVEDTENLVIKSDNVDKIIEAITGGDEEFTLYCMESGDLPLGEIIIQPYESEEDMIVNYSDNNFCDHVIVKFNKGDMND